MSDRLATLPDLLTTLTGNRIQTREAWEQTRRLEILTLLNEQMYGIRPVERPDKLSFHVLSSEPALDGLAMRKQIRIEYSGTGGTGAIRLLLFVPAAGPKPAPAFLLAAIKGQQVLDAPDPTAYEEFWPVRQIVKRGYAAAAYQVEDLDPDDRTLPYLDGVHGVFGPFESPKPANAWGSMSAWAWGASRILDYLETDPDVDDQRVAIIGHSRGGKAALWAGASDSRFAMVISNNSGCSGAAISRGKAGEQLRNINNGNPHWFNDLYKQYNDRENELPFDQHMLLALVAPRLLYVTSATEDGWADPESEFLGIRLAEPAWRLYGFKGLGTSDFPAPDSPIHGDRLGYHLRTGKHDLTATDWQWVLDFADSRFR